MALIADNGTIITIEATWSSGQPFENVFFYHRDENDPVQATTDVLNNWQDHLVAQFPNNYTLQGARYIDVNAADGDTGFVAKDAAKPYVGTIAGQVSPPALSIVVTKNIGGQRNARAGRMYLPPAQETEMDEDGIVLQSKRNSLDALLALFHDGTDDAGEIGYIAVLHQVQGQPVSWSRVESYTTKARLGVQRRRMNLP